jgi:hypothetical protein
MNTLSDGGYAAPIAPTHVYEGFVPPRPRIAPRTLAKMRDMDYLNLARKRFLDGTECRSPAEVVELGMKSIFDWCTCLAEARSEVGRPEHYDN